jgi:hypothetical protein
MKDEHDAWKEHGFDLDEEFEWSEFFSPEQAAEWRNYGFSLEEAYDWDRKCFSASNAKEWAQKYFCIQEAERWRQLEVSPKDALEWNDVLSYKRILACQSAGLSPITIGRWIDDAICQYVATDKAAGTESDITSSPGSDTLFMSRQAFNTWIAYLKSDDRTKPEQAPEQE